MDSRIRELSAELESAFAELRLALDSLAAVVRSDWPRAAWIADHPALGQWPDDPRERAVRLYLALWAADDGDARSTIGCPGLVGCSREALGRARDCNVAKDRFRRRVLTLKKRDPTTLEHALRHLGEDGIGEAGGRRIRLHLKQAYRHIPWLAAEPLKVGFTWSRSGRVIQRITVEHAAALLARLARRMDVEADRARLRTLSTDSMLARVRELAPHLRANVVFSADGGFLRRLVQAPIPLLYPTEPGRLLPEFVPLEVEPPDRPRTRLRRSDARIEPEPFLPAIGVHRYLDRKG